MKESKAMMKKEVSFMKKKGAPKSMLKHEMKEAGMKKMRAGGMPMGPDGKPTFVGDGKGKMAKGGIATSLKAHAAAPASKAHGMKSGGMAASKMGSVKASSSRDGIATKGKTKGKMIAMKNGGKC